MRNSHNELIDRIRYLYSDVLGQSVAPSDGFFEAGGNSLLALKLVAALQNELEIEVSLIDVLTCKSASDMADVVMPRLTDAPEFQSYDVRPRSWPATYAQARAFRGRSMSYDSDPFVIQLGYRLRGQLNEGALALAVERVIKRHDILRARFVDAPSGVRQVIQQSYSDVQLSRVDLRNHPDPMAFAHAFSRTAGYAVATSMPFVRGSLSRTDTEEWMLILVIDHVVCDGISTDILAKDLSGAYQEVIRPNTTALPPAQQFGSWATAQHERLTDAHLQQQVARWRPLLPGNIVDLGNTLPGFVHCRPGYRQSPGSLSFQIRGEPLRNIRARARSADCSLYTFLLTVLALVIASTSRRDLITITSNHSGRFDRLAESVVGWLTDIMLLRVHLHDVQSFADALHIVRETVQGAITLSDVPFLYLAEAVWGTEFEQFPYERGVYFSLDQFASSLELDDVACVPLAIPDLSPRVLRPGLEFQATDNESYVDVELTYSRDNYPPALASGLGELLRRYTEGRGDLDSLTRAASTRK